MINFSFENFDNTDQIMVALNSLENLSYELRVNGYDYADKKEHAFELDGFFVTVYTDEDGDVSEVKVSFIQNEDIEEIH